MIAAQGEAARRRAVRTYAVETTTVGKTNQNKIVECDVSLVLEIGKNDNPAIAGSAWPSRCQLRECWKKCFPIFS